MTSPPENAHSHVGPPHVSPCKGRRPHGANRFFVTSPKAGRRVEIWGIPQLHHWIELEADPRVKSLCERPLSVQDGTQTRPVDFWAAGPALNKYVFLVKQPSSLSDDLAPSFPAFRAWAAEQGCEVEEHVPVALTADRQVWYRNWTSVLQQLSSFRSYLTPQLLDVIRCKVSDPIAIADLTKGLPNESLDIVRAAAFALVHKGDLQFLAFSDELLSDALQVAPL